MQVLRFTQDDKQSCDYFVHGDFGHILVSDERPICTALVVNSDDADDPYRETTSPASRDRRRRRADYRITATLDSARSELRGRETIHFELRLTYDDGTSENVRLPVEMWNLGQYFTYRVPARKVVRQVEVDPRGVLPDVDRANNLWTRR